MSNSIDVITSLDDEVYQIKDVTETPASILPADHILLVKLSDADKQALIDLFELKTNSLVQHDELNRRIDNIVGKITELSDADPAVAAEQVKLELENDIAQVLTLAQANELKIGTKADQIDLENTQIQVEQNRLSILTKADIQALALLAQLVDTKADQAYVNQQIANLVGSAPEALNTIYELAAAIQNEQGLIDSLNKSVANRVRFDIATQALTEIQKQNARTNIDAEKVGTAQQLVSQITAASIGAATAAQGAKADTALQSADVAPVALSGLFSSLGGQNKIFDVVFNTYALGTNAAITATDTLGQMLGKLQAQINNVGSGGTAPYPELPVATKNSVGGVIVSDYLKIDTSGQLSVDFETTIEATVESATSGLEQTLGAQYTQIIPIGNIVIIDGTPKFGHSISVKLIEGTRFVLQFPETNEDYTLDVYIGTTSDKRNIYAPSNDVTLVAQFRVDVLAYSEPKFYVDVSSNTVGALIYNIENISRQFNYTNDTSWLNIIAVFNDGIDQDKVRELTLDGLNSFPIRINTSSQANFPAKLVEALQETETTFNTQLNNYALKTEIPLLERTPSSNTLPVLANRIPLYSLGTDGNFVLCTPNAWIKLDENLFMPAYTSEVLGLHQ